jgi:putative (di)nucleoside polyphosphate hydrolase
MIGPRASHLPYRRGVGALLLNRDGRVFVAKRIDTPGEAWQLPQGGLARGESPKEAVLRELAEEIGTNKAEIVAESAHWHTYDLPAAVAGRPWRGKYRGQRLKWFALRFQGEDGDIDLKASSHPEFEAWKWVGIDALPGLIVDFKRPIYQALVAEFGHLARAAAETRS